MKATFPRNLRFKETATGQQGHEETRQHSEVSVSEEEEALAERGTEDSQPMSEACFTVRVDTDFCSSGSFSEEESTADQRNPRRDTDGAVPKPQGNPQNFTLLPSFFVAPICTEIPGSPPYRLIPMKREVTKLAAVTPKKENRSESVDTLGNPKCMPEGMPTIPATPKCGMPKPRNPKKNKANAASRGPQTDRPSTQPPPGRRPPRPSTEPSQGKGAEHLVVENAGGRGEVKEKLVYVVEEKGKSVTKVETDLFSVNEILTIKKDLLELSEFAKKLKQLKERSKPQESAKAEDGTCRCEPNSKILKDVNKRIEALEVRQEELEKGRKSSLGEELPVKKLKTPSSTHREQAKPTVNAMTPGQPKASATVTRRGPPGLSNTADLVNELQDIKEQLKRLEDRRSSKPGLEEMPVEWVDSSEVGRTVWRSTALTKGGCSRKVKPKKKNGAIAVFSSKTYIFSPDKVEDKTKESKGTESKTLRDKVGFEETRIINWLKGVCSGGSDFKVLLKPSPTMEESLAEGKVEFTRKNYCGDLEEMGNLGNQEPQKNRATYKDSRQDDFLKKDSSSGKVVKKRSYKECFVSPSGRFFAWMKRSSDKVMRNFCTDWPQPKVLRKIHPRHISRTTSTGSIVSFAKDSPPRGLRCSVLSEISLSGNIQDFVRVVCKSEKATLNENMMCLGKKDRRSISKERLQREEKNGAVRRREPRRPRPRDDSDVSLSSSFSEIMDTMDFDITSNSLDGSRWQKSNEFHAQVFSCFGQPDYLLDTRQKRTEWYRETDQQRRKREKKERQAVKRLQKKTAKMKNSCEKRKRQLCRKQDKYSSRCIIDTCDFGKDYWKRYPPAKSAQQPKTTVEASREPKQIPGEPYRPNVYKKQECPPVKQPCVSGRYSGQSLLEEKKLRVEKEVDVCSYGTGTSAESLREPVKRQPEVMKSVLSAERPSFERRTLGEFFKNFGWLYPRVGEICGEYPQRKKVEHPRVEEICEEYPQRKKVEPSRVGEICEEYPQRKKVEHPSVGEICVEYPQRKKVEHAQRPAKDVRRTRIAENDLPKDRFPICEENNRGSARSSTTECDRPPRNAPHNHDPDHVENCDCVRLYLQNQVEKKLAALRNIQLSSTESMASVASKSDPDCPKRQVCLPKSASRDRKENLKFEPRRSKTYLHDIRDLKYCNRKEGVRKPEDEEENHSRARQPRPPMPEPHSKKHHTARKRKMKDHPTKINRKVRERDEDSESFCQYCGTAPCLIGDKHDIGKRGESSGSTTGEEAAPLRGDAPIPRKEQCKPYDGQPQENLSLLSYLCQLWRNRYRQPNASPAEGRVFSPGRENLKTSANNPPGKERGRGRMKPVCRRCSRKRRNFGRSAWRFETRTLPPEICIFREKSPEEKDVRGRPRPRMSDHPPTHAHCFLINDRSDNATTKTDLLCFPQDSQTERRCRQRRSTQEAHQRKDKAIECHFVRDSQDVTDKTTDTEDLRSLSREKIDRRHLKHRLASLHCLWKNLRRCTMQKAMYGREVGRCIRRSLSGLDSYDCWWSDTWPKRRRHRHRERRYQRR